MSLKDRGYVTVRWNDFGGGLNLLNSNDSIDDKQWQVGVNVASEGNKLISLPWYAEYVEPWTGISKWQAIALYSQYILTIHNRNLYLYNTTTWVTYTKTNAVANAVDTYSIITTKAFSGKIAIVILNTNLATAEDIVAYEFDGTTFTTKTFTSLTNKNFKCGLFYQGKLLLGWNPLYPSSLYSSKTGLVASPDNIYDFSWYDSSAQNVWDGEPIVSIISNHNELFVLKTNSVWRNQWVYDTGADAVSKSYAYNLRQESATGALNSRCAIAVEQDVLYFDWLNIRRLSYEININALNDDSISKEISNIFSSLPSNQTKNAEMYYAYPFVKLCLRDKFSTNNSIGIIYNIVDKSYSIQTGVEIVQWVGGFSNNKRTAYFVTSQTSMVYQDNIWYAYNGGNINLSHKSKRYVLWDGVDYKRISQVELYWKISPWLKWTIDIYVNGNIIDSREIFFEDYILPTTGSTPFWDSLFGSSAEGEDTPLRDFVVRYEYYKDWRDFSFGVRSNWQWRFELHGLNLMYKNIKAYDIHS